MRTLRADERSTADDGADLPLVVEPAGANDLAAACAAHGDHLLRLLDLSGGALLLSANLFYLFRALSRGMRWERAQNQARATTRPRRARRSTRRADPPAVPELPDPPLP